MRRHVSISGTMLSLLLLMASQAACEPAGGSGTALVTDSGQTAGDGAGGGQGDVAGPAHGDGLSADASTPPIDGATAGDAGPCGAVAPSCYARPYGGCCMQDQKTPAVCGDAGWMCTKDSTSLMEDCPDICPSDQG